MSLQRQCWVGTVTLMSYYCSYSLSICYTLQDPLYSNVFTETVLGWYRYTLMSYYCFYSLSICYTLQDPLYSNVFTETVLGWYRYTLMSYYCFYSLSICYTLQGPLHSNDRTETVFGWYSSVSFSDSSVTGATFQLSPCVILRCVQKKLY